MTLAAVIAVVALTAVGCLLRRREPRVWTVWAGVGAGHCTPIGSRKTRRQAAAMLARYPAVLVAVDVRYHLGVVPVDDDPPGTVMRGA